MKNLESRTSLTQDSIPSLMLCFGSLIGAREVKRRVTGLESRSQFKFSGLASLSQSLRSQLPVPLAPKLSTSTSQSIGIPGPEQKQRHKPRGSPTGRKTTNWTAARSRAGRPDVSRVFDAHGAPPEHCAAPE
ncbi:hypothetical protein VNO77_37772 [Canavalia gladiata]|uniref:Uncharacterized protein n=1 Tax=Canavalia gladiata TaxID=3824 RepID=A0AAN9PW85_CANGL